MNDTAKPLLNKINYNTRKLSRSIFYFLTTTICMNVLFSI